MVSSCSAYSLFAWPLYRTLMIMMRLDHPFYHSSRSVPRLFHLGDFPSETVATYIPPLAPILLVCILIDLLAFLNSALRQVHYTLCCCGSGWLCLRSHVVCRVSGSRTSYKKEKNIRKQCHTCGYVDIVARYRSNTCGFHIFLYVDY